MENEKVVENEKKTQENNHPKIINITMYRNYNFVKFDDTDSSVDYFDSYTLTTKHTIEWLKKYGNNLIEVDTVNCYNDPKYHKRIKRIAKECGYSISFENKKHVSHIDFQEWYQPVWTLKKEGVN